MGREIEREARRNNEVVRTSMFFELPCKFTQFIFISFLFYLSKSNPYLYCSLLVKIGLPTAAGGNKIKACM